MGIRLYEMYGKTETNLLVVFNGRMTRILVKTKICGINII